MLSAPAAPSPPSCRFLLAAAFRFSALRPAFFLRCDLPSPPIAAALSASRTSWSGHWACQEGRQTPCRPTCGSLPAGVFICFLRFNPLRQCIRAPSSCCASQRLRSGQRHAVRGKQCLVSSAVACSKMTRASAKGCKGAPPVGARVAAAAAAGSSGGSRGGDFHCSNCALRVVQATILSDTTSIMKSCSEVWKDPASPHSLALFCLTAQFSQHWARAESKPIKLPVLVL